jgi:hypothetical protein
MGKNLTFQVMILPVWLFGFEALSPLVLALSWHRLAGSKLLSHILAA